MVTKRLPKGAAQRIDGFWKWFRAHAEAWPLPEEGFDEARLEPLHMALSRWRTCASS
jgi:hypothetical protein